MLIIFGNDSAVDSLPQTSPSFGATAILLSNNKRRLGTIDVFRTKSLFDFLCYTRCHSLVLDFSYQRKSVS